MSDDLITVYEKPTCTTCRRLFELLTERGVDFDRVDYHVEGISEERLRELLAKAGLSPRDVLRTKEALAAETDGLSDDELIAFMAANPVVVQRPMVERGGRAVLARPPERVLELLD